MPRRGCCQRCSPRRERHECDVPGRLSGRRGERIPGQNLLPGPVQCLTAGTVFLYPGSSSPARNGSTASLLQNDRTNRLELWLARPLKTVRMYFDRKRSWFKQPPGNRTNLRVPCPPCTIV